MVVIDCATCGKPKEIRTAEYSRQVKLGRSAFFCCRSCSAMYNNRERHASDIEKICPVCGSRFTTKQDRHERSFCSRSCASKGSMTDLRKEAQCCAGLKHQVNLNTEVALRKREGWKYMLLQADLENNGLEYVFEMALPGASWIYDLALPKQKMIFEFDGPDHNYQAANDADKDRYAQSLGWSVTRISVVSNTVIDPACIAILQLT